MGQNIVIVAQNIFDDFLQNYADGTTFFTLDDFVQRAGFFAADFYRQEWKVQYDEIRQERRTEVVGFEPSVLSEQFSKVKKDGKEWVGDIEKPAMSLPFDMQSSSFQNVFDIKTGEELERSNINEIWQYKYLPFTGKFLYVIDRKKIRIFTKGNCNIQEVRILYVPSIQIGDTEADLPDGIVSYVMMNTLNYFRSAKEGVIVKKAQDQNFNKVMESEINKAALKP